MSDANDVRRRAAAWLAADPEPETRAATQALLDDTTDGADERLASCFGEWLEFGTAGIRGLFGPGPGRMNRALVRRVTAGLADYLGRTVPEARARGVVIGHDARRGSVEFAADAAGVLSAAGFRVIRLPKHAPTPLVAFALLHLRAAAGIVVTASHNPPDYNGYKVYWENGAQIVPPHDTGIASAIASNPPYALSDALVEDAPASLSADFLAALDAQLQAVPRGTRPLRLVYTPLHGVGAPLCEAALRSEGADVLTVAQQREPDGRFPTVAFPNPEEKGALDLAEALADREGIDLVIANDPDADRVATVVRIGVVRRGGKLRRLTGDELGVVLGDALLEARGIDRNRADRAFVAHSIVSSDLLARVAAHHGAECFETLTGFKWIWNGALDHEARGGTFVFGYEEALGYSVGRAVHDKDGIGAAQLVARLARSERGLWERLSAIWERHGFITSRQKSLVDSAPGGIARNAGRMAALRASPPSEVAGVAVARVRDLAQGADGLAPHDCLTWWLEDGTRIMFRPSGTEPKLKVYLQVLETYDAGAVARGDARLDALQAAVFATFR